MKDSQGSSEARERVDAARRSQGCGTTALIPKDLVGTVGDCGARQDPAWDSCCSFGAYSSACFTMSTLTAVLHVARSR